MISAICTTFHKYTPFGGEYYEPLFDFYMMQMEKYKNEFDKLYLLDSNWGIKKVPEWAEVIQINVHDRYYDAYKKNLHKIKEDFVLFLDNDMVIYRGGLIKKSFDLLEKYDVVSHYADIGQKHYEELNSKSKFCLQWFATHTNLIMKYRNVDWGSNMPESETIGKLTEAMLKDKVKPFEWEEDYSNILIDGTIHGNKSKDLGFYHIRAGSTPAYLLATLHAGDVKTYYDYLKNQPKTEYLRQTAWYWYMCYKTKNEKVMKDTIQIIKDADITEKNWYAYFKNFTEYHGLNAEDIARFN